MQSLDPTVAAANPEEADAKAELDALLYDQRGEDGTFVGTAGSGAFRVSSWEAGKHAIFAANQDYREGRPFVDSIEIQMGRPAHDRVVDLELNKTDFAQIPAEQARQATDRGVRVSISQPNELLALVFLGSRSGKESARMREAIAAMHRSRGNCKFYFAEGRRTCRRIAAAVVQRHCFSFSHGDRMCARRKKSGRKSRHHRS